jgi:signal transduction histidine kinase
MDYKAEEGVLRLKPSAYLQRLLGRDLISTDHIAIAELVKNSYDAGATQVTLELKRNPPQELVISDDGSGMSLEDFELYWMSPGYSEKPDVGEIEVHHHARALLGEKGIGRFAADKLAEELVVITKKKGEDEALWVRFDWEEFNTREKKIWEIPVRYSHAIHPKLGKYQSGTILELNNLRHIWKGSDWRRLRRELQNIVSPRRAPSNFKIVANADGWQSGEIQSIFEAQEGYRYTFSISRSGNVRAELVRPSKTATSIEKPQIEKKQSYMTNEFGTIHGRFYYVDRPQKLLDLGFEPGVGIYRDSFRVEPYGRADDDWLEIRSLKASRQGHAPTPNKLFGFIEISRNRNPELRDITNRQGLLDTPEFQQFRSFVIDRYREFAKVIEDDRSQLNVEVPQLAGQRARAAREIRAETFTDMAAQMAHQLRQPLNNIGLNASNLRTYLNKKGWLDSEILRFTDNITLNIKRMNENVTNLTKLARGLRDAPVDIEVGSFVKSLVSRYNDEFQQSGAVLDFADGGNDYSVRFSEMALDWILDNFVRNALRAVSQLQDSSKHVVVSLEKNARSGLRICVADNGEGVPAQYRHSLFKESVQSEYGGFGMGLYWSQFWAEQYGANLSYEDLSPMGAKFSIEFGNGGRTDE